MLDVAIETLMLSVVMLRIIYAKGHNEVCYAECHYVESHLCKPNVIMLCIVAPIRQLFIVDSQNELLVLAPWASEQ